MGAQVLTTDSPLTEEEQQLAEEHHGLIYKFLGYYRLSDDFYDVAVFGYLRAARIYLARPELQKYSFSTIAFKCMLTDLGHYRDSENRKLHTQALSLDYKSEDSYSLYGKIGDEGTSFFDDDQPAISENPLYQYTDLLSERQYGALMLQTSGYTHREIGEMIGLTVSGVRAAIRNGKRKVIDAAEKHEKTAHAAGTA